MKRVLFGATIVVGLLAAVGCGANNRASLPGVTAVKAPQKVAFVLKVPVKTPASSAKRSPAYVSPNTQSVSFAVSTDGGTTFGDPQVVAVDTASTTQCPQDAGYYECTVGFDAQPGPIVVLVKTFASIDGSGNALSQNQTSQSVTEGGSNTLTFTLDGVAAKFAVTLAPSSVDAGISGTTVTATWSALDDSGATIVAPGNIADSAGTALGDPSLAIADSSADFGTPSYDAVTRTWTMTYDGGDISDQTFTVSKNAANSGVTDGIATLTVTPAATATPAPTASPTATPVANAIVNGDFETSSTAIAPWFVCYTQSQVYSVVDASPAPQSTAVPTAGATAVPTTHPSPDDVTVAQTVPVGNAGATGAVHGDSNAVLVGRNTQPLGRGTSGVCQTVTVPASNPQLTFWLYEGGDTDNTSHQIHLGMIYPSTTTFTAIGGFSPGSGGTAYTTTNLPSTILFAQNNCYNSHPGASGDLGGCAVTATSSALGGQWLEKGPYDLSAFAGEPVTIFLGKWGAASTTTLYDYVFYDDVVLSGS